MYVLFISSDNNRSSGAFLSEVYLNKILNEKHGIKTKVILPKKGNGEELLKQNNIDYAYVQSFNWIVSCATKNKPIKKLEFFVRGCFNVLAIKKLKRIIKKEHVDLIHINTTYSYVGMKAGLKTKTPVVWHLREFLEEDQDRQIYNKEKGYELLKKANRIIAISSQVYKKYSSILKTKNLVTILNGIDVQKFYVEQRPMFQSQKIKLIYGGGYAGRKGPFTLLSSLKLLKDFGITDFEIAFIGEPNEKFKKAVTKYGLDKNAVYLGYQQNVTDFYKTADIAFSTSACEAFGRKTVEAMLAGCLVISSNTGGSLDIITDGATGLFYKEDDPIDLTFKILYAINNKEVSKNIAERGREFAAKELTADLNAKKIKELYKEVLNDE